MNLARVVDAMARQTSVLLAQLATQSGGARNWSIRPIRSSWTWSLRFENKASANASSPTCSDWRFARLVAICASASLFTIEM